MSADRPYFEDIEIGSRQAFGACRVTREEVIGFAETRDRRET